MTDNKTTVLEVKVKLADYWKVNYDEDGDIHGSGQMVDPIFIAVVNLLADRVIKGKNDFYGALGSLVGEIRRELIAEKLEPLIIEAIEGSVRQTNRYGEGTCEPTTLRTMIVDEAKKILNHSNNDRYDSRAAGTLLERTIRAEVESIYLKELREEIAKAKAAANEAVKKEAAALIAETISKLAAAQKS